MQLEQKIAQFKQLAQQHLPQFPDIEIFSGKQEGYRLRAEFGVYHKFEPEYSVHHVVFDQKTKQRIFCDQGFNIASPLINRYMIAVAHFLKFKKEFARKLFQIEYLSTMSNAIIISLIFHRKLDAVNDRFDATELLEFLYRINLNDNAPVNVIVRARKDSLIIGDNFICEKLTVNGKEHKLLQVENSFSQPNGEINQMMLAYVEKHVHTDQDLLELYCGVGNFTMVLARCARKVLATEINKQAVEFVKRNLHLNNITNVDVGRISAEEFTQAMNKVRPFKRLAHLDLDSYQFETVFVDPPRSGLDNDSLDMIGKYKQIVYVSCNPQTLMPNLEYLVKEHGYKIDHLAVFDQFPQTPHLESCAILSKVTA